MSETLPQSIEPDANEKERHVKDFLKELDRLHAFVRENPGSSRLPEIATMLRDALVPVTPEEPMLNTPETPPMPEPSSDEIAPAPIVPEAPTTVHPEKETRQQLPFEQARRQSAPLSDETIQRALDNDLRLPSGEKPLFTKSYFDYVPADASDKAFFSDHAAAIDQRDQLTDFIARELKVIDPATHAPTLGAEKQAFINGLEEGKRQFREYVKGREARKEFYENRVPTAALEFHGFTVETKDGAKGDVLDDTLPGVVANIRIQRELTDRFVHWSSGAYVEQKIAGKKPSLEEVIFLNPTPQRSVKVFAELVKAADERGLAIKAKIYDRVSDSAVMQPYDVDDETYGVRADGIVLNVSKDEAEQLFAVVQEVAARNEDALRDRATPRMAYRLGAGVAVGDKPTAANESLTSHRVKVFDNVVNDVRLSGETDPARRRELFDTLWRREATKHNINPDNPAFNFTA